MRKREFEHGVIYNGDCLDVMPDVIADHSIDMILADLPYGTTACKWDVIIDFDDLWKQYERAIKEHSAIILSGVQPFVTDLIMSNRKLFRHELIWDKDAAGSFALAEVRPMAVHENLCVFGKGKVKYYPILTAADPKKIRPKNMGSATSAVTFSRRSNIAQSKAKDTYDNTKRYPKSIITYSKYKKECNHLNRIHPTQKPVELFQYLIMTYTNKGDVVLDNVIGSGTTAIAAYNTGRKWIGIEKDPEIFDMACERIEKETRQQHLFN